MHLDYRIELPPSFNLVYYQVPLPECLQRACVFDPWPPPSSFPSSLVAHPAQEAVDKLGGDFVVAFRRIQGLESAVSKCETQVS